jgi:hypothetical protein
MKVGIAMPTSVPGAKPAGVDEIVLQPTLPGMDRLDRAIAAVF